MVRLYKLKFEKLLDSSFEGLRMFCLCFWGPIILVETLYTMAYYEEILTGCIDNIADGFMNVMVYMLIIFFLISLSVTVFILYSLFSIFLKVKSLWP
jgi:predicted membrane protein